ncbi:MAG: PocR ligand-binding domain-containing protein [Verrucomicrobia bacterium]|nr:PocR ligand-binding domain-containing protein [Verrucomicrobiota bacterium]
MKPHGLQTEFAMGAGGRLVPFPCRFAGRQPLGHPSFANTMVSNLASITLRDLVDISAFQKLADSFSRLTGIATAILDLQGEILVASGWQKICTEFHRKNKVAASRCLESDTILAGKLPQGERYNLYKCKNGLVDVAVPINIGNVHVGNLFLGQFLLESPDMDLFASQAEAFGFNKDLYLEALSKVPVLSIERIDHAVEFLTNLTVIIGNTGLDRKRLFESNNQLEQQVQQRTAELTYSNERLRVLSEASLEGIILTENGVIIEANEKVATLLGFQRPIEIVGIPVTNFIAPEERANVEGKIRSGYDQPYQSLGLTKDGVAFPIEIHGETFSCQGRQVRGTVIRDLTEQKEAEKEIHTLRGILPLCSFCKKIRDDEGYWEQVDVYIHKHTEADISHSVCPECMKAHYPKEYKKFDLDKE